MISPKLLRESPDIVRQSLKNRGCSDDVFNTLQQLDVDWRKKQQELEDLQALRNKSVPKGKPGDDERKKLSELSQKLKETQLHVADFKDKLESFSLVVPNICQDTTPVGNDENGNVIVRSEGTPTRFNFKAKSHDQLAVDLDIFMRLDAAFEIPLGML